MFINKFNPPEGVEKYRLAEIDEKVRGRDQISPIGD